MLELAGCDMVLGVQWLQTLGTIPWNFKKLTMPFTFEGQNISLTGLASTQWLEESTCREMDKLKRNEVVLQLIGEDELTWGQHP